MTTLFDIVEVGLVPLQAEFLFCISALDFVQAKNLSVIITCFKKKEETNIN